MLRVRMPGVECYIRMMDKELDEDDMDVEGEDSGGVIAE